MSSTAADRSAPNPTILNSGEPLPSGCQLPPRQPQAWDTFAYIRNPDGFCQQNFQTYGPIFQTGVFGGTTVFVGSAAANQMVFNGDLNYTEIALPPTTLSMFGEYSLFQRPDLHRERKSALTPGFTGAILEGYLPTMAHKIIQGLQSWQVDSEISLFPRVSDLCFDVLVPLLVGVDFEVGTNPSWDQWPIQSKQQLQKTYETFFNGFYGLVPWKSPLTAYGRGWQARQQLLSLMEAVIAEKRKSLTIGDDQPPADQRNLPSNFLEMMLMAQSHQTQGVFSEDSLIQNQCLLQLWASHDEISALVANMIYLIGQHPQVLAMLREEQESFSPPDDPQGWNLQHLKQLAFLEATLKECLRILPPSSTANRRFTKTVILDGIVYQKGWGVIVEPRISHQIPEYFEHPDRFDPSRFLPPRNEGKLYNFIPFGGGVHGCLGAQMAMAMAKVFIVYVLQKFQWQITKPATFNQFPLRLMKADYKIKMETR